MDSLAKLQIIIPVYNEGGSIVKTLCGIREKVVVPHEITIIYDFDEDDTLPAVKAYLAEDKSAPITLVKNQFGRGGLNALKTGFQNAKQDIVLVTMADGSDDLSLIDRMYGKLAEGYDIVCASRYMKGGGQIGGGKIKGWISRLAGVSLYYLTGIPTRDITNNFKMYRKKVLDRIDFQSDGGFEIAMEITVKAYSLGYRITEVPYVWPDRAVGQSRFKLMQWLPKYWRWYWYALRGRFLGLSG